MKRKTALMVLFSFLIFCVGGVLTVRIAFPVFSHNLWVFFYLDFVWDRHADECQRRGDLIIEALLQYKNDYGSYPETLDKLVPKYIDEIPKLPDYNRWSYNVNEDGSFGLDFSAFEYNYPCYYYESNDGQWNRNS